MSGSRTMIAVEDRLTNPHPGDILREDFLVGTDITCDEIVANAELACEILHAILEATAPVDAEIDLRLSRYFGVSEGFFLRLQNAYNLEEAWRAHGAEFERIQSRAA